DRRADRLHGRLEGREGGRQRLPAEIGGAGEAAALGVVPAVRAGVLAAGEAEVEGLVERLELLRRDFALLVAAGVGERLFQGRIVGEDVVPETPSDDPEPAQAAPPRRRGLERVARPAAFAEGFGQD